MTHDDHGRHRVHWWAIAVNAMLAAAAIGTWAYSSRDAVTFLLVFVLILAAVCTVWVLSWAKLMRTCRTWEDTHHHNGIRYLELSQRFRDATGYWPEEYPPPAVDPHATGRHHVRRVQDVNGRTAAGPDKLAPGVT